MQGKVIEFFDTLGEDSNLIGRNIYINYGKYPVLSGQTSNKGVFGYINKYKYDTECLTWTTFGVKAGTVFYRTGKFSIGRNCAGLKVKKKYKKDINLKYAKIILQKKVMETIGSKECRGNASIDLVQNILIKFPNIAKQNEFVELIEKQKEIYVAKVINKKILEKKIKKLFNSLKVYDNPIILAQHFDIILGTQFSEKEAYSLFGQIPVYTASINKPSYYVKDNICGKVKAKGKCLIWARKGNAGKLKLIDDVSEFYITDVSGIIKPKDKFKQKYNLKFLQYYLESIFMKNIRTQDNNPQINKSDIESMQITFPTKEVQDELAKSIENILNL
jgi:restriction endonuclease S subunit